MVDWVSDLSDSIDAILDTTWDERDGLVVPESEKVVLADGAVKIEASFLYADLAGSSVLARLCPWETTAKIVRAYLDVSTRLIRAYRGEIRSFDGDRVMGVFMGTEGVDAVTYCAREIDHMVEFVLGPKAHSRFRSVSNNQIKLKHCVGVDYGTARAVRAGIRNNNDLVWIGKPPSFAAKLSDVRSYPHTIYISSRVHSRLSSSAKEDAQGSSIWVSKTFKFAGTEETVYSTKLPKTP
jgi:adenylate cyclase